MPSTEMKIPTIKDLVFHEISPEYFQAKHTFRNGYTVLIRYGKGTATTIGAPYEVQVIPLPPKGHTYLSDDIVGYSTADDCNVMLQEVAHLKKPENNEKVINPKFDW